MPSPDQQCQCKRGVRHRHWDSSRSETASFTHRSSFIPHPRRAQPSPACPGSGRAQLAIPHCYTLPPKGPARAFPLAADRQRRRRHPHSPTPHGARTAQEGESASTDLPAGLNSRRKRNPLICPRRCATGSGLDSGAGFLPDTIGERTERTREGLWRGVVAMVA